jgi:hypothetical protein
MKRSDLNQFAAFALLGFCVWWMREGPVGRWSFLVSTAVVFIFWFFHSIRFSLSTLRSLFVLILGFGLVFLILRGSLPFFSADPITGLPNHLDLNPALIGRLKVSHERALEVYFDHRPNSDERYYPWGVLGHTGDGLHYVQDRVLLDLSLMPAARVWASQELGLKKLSEKIKKIQDWWALEFHYSLSPGELRGSHPLDDFLFSRKIGFCEHYSGALSTLLKLSGTEARVVVGFSGGSWNPVLHQLSYEMADAHAWVEAWDDLNHHWVVLDPTLWVSAESNELRSDFSTLVELGLVLFGLLMVFGLAQRRGQDPLEKFVSQLDVLEKRDRFSSRGLTLSERVERLMIVRPAKATPLRDSLLLYLKVYYQAQSGTSQGVEKIQFSRSLSRW